MGKIGPNLMLWGARMGYMSYGWDVGVFGGVLQTPSQTPDTDTAAMIAAAFLLASWLGCVITASPWSDRIGRRTIICASAYNIPSIEPARGIGNGFVVNTGPIYVAETTTITKMCGPLVGILMGFACTATALAYWIDFGFTYATWQVVWRFPIAFQIVWSILVIALLYGYNETSLKCQSEILIELRQEIGEKLRWSDLIMDKSPTQAVRCIRDGVILIGIAYLMGINMIFYYMTTIFRVYIGLEAVTSSVCAGAAATLLAIGIFFGSFFCERTGRRKGLLWGSGLQSVFMIYQLTSSACAAMLFGWILVFSPTWAPMPYIYVSESMPLHRRHTGVRLNIGWKTWIWFLIFNVLGFLYVYFFIFETWGRTLGNVNELFYKNNALDEHIGSEPETTPDRVSGEKAGHVVTGASNVDNKAV
ncbi:major facilitator superfamily domain-containing protein [Bisporella sp. PMI_857]|nr:major facilitator superfamily domain-containing protein [Bisporella sp. PMI_857]